MAKHRIKSPVEEEEENGEENGTSSMKHYGSTKSKRMIREQSTESESEAGSKRSEDYSRGKKKRSRTPSSSKRGSRRRKKHDCDSYSEDESDEDSYSDSESGSSEYSSEEGHSDSVSESDEGERGRRRRKEKRRREEREKEKRRRRRRQKEKQRRRKEREDEKLRKKKKKRDKDRGKKGAVTNSWGKYGIIRETDMWNKRPEFTAWLAEVKQVNLESLPNWEEKLMFKEFMEDHNTATFPSKKYYGLDTYYKHKMEKEMKKGVKKVVDTERTVFNDEEQRRLELMREREKHKEEQVEALKRSMQSGMAQAMKEQAQLREEMAYQYKLGNFEAAAAIQRRLDPDAAM